MENTYYIMNFQLQIIINFVKYKINLSKILSLITE